MEVIRCGKRITIYNENEARAYSNVAPGINHPIVVADKVELVIGVSGDPVVIQRYAELAILTAELQAFNKKLSGVVLTGSIVCVTCYLFSL